MTLLAPETCWSRHASGAAVTGTSVEPRRFAGRFRRPGIPWFHGGRPRRRHLASARIRQSEEESVQVYSMTFMPWPRLPADHSGSAWVVCPNSTYDPVAGTDLYRDYLDLLVAADRLGFDGVALNEHHQTPYCG